MKEGVSTTPDQRKFTRVGMIVVDQYAGPDKPTHVVYTMFKEVGGKKRYITKDDGEQGVEVVHRVAPQIDRGEVKKLKLNDLFSSNPKRK